MQARIRKLELGLGTGYLKDVEAFGLLDRVLDERRLSDARLALQHQRAAAAEPGAVQQLRELLTLTVPTDQHDSTLVRPGGHD